MAAEPLPVIIDTDCGRDDFMAIAFLLARRDVQIEAITVANGLAHVGAGAGNVLRLAEMGGHSRLPVYIGRGTPMHGEAAFPEPWRKNSDEILHGLLVPEALHAPEEQPAADYLASRLRNRRRPVRILALGPLTNLAEALERMPGALNGVEVVIMGGAVRVPGNLGEGGAFHTNNKTAEWNLFVDPVAAERVFAAGARIRLIPLDATNEVPVDAAFLRNLGAQAQTPLGRFVHDLVARECDFQDGATCYAWDALAAAALVDPSVVRMRPLAIEIKQSPPEAGRTEEIRGQKPNTEVALAADAARFRRIYVGAFTRADSTGAGL
ncbi:MAG TPA: nucleoside hydrolase [Bryobacteraceae bacterium]|nr:nucleoside hydrolase [Bryobacteraceae bacterium]